MKKILLSSLTASTLFVAAHAEDVKVTPIVTHTELGYIQTNGNTNTKTFNLDATAKKSWGKQEGKIHFDGQYADDDGVETKNKYLIELNYNYNFTQRLAFDYLVGYKDDKFSGYDYQFYTGPGARYKAITSDVQNLSIEGNILYSQDQYSDEEYDSSGNVIHYPNPDNIPVATIVSGAKNDYAAYRLKGLYDYKITQTLKFAQELSIRGQFDEMSNYFAFSKSSLTAKLSDIFSAGVSYKVDYAHLPPADKSSTDSTFTFNLIADY
jgi:putative salt-induced outer membrane protein